jgi:hypothetical protein
MKDMLASGVAALAAVGEASKTTEVAVESERKRDVNFLGLLQLDLLLF